MLNSKIVAVTMTACLAICVARPSNSANRITVESKAVGQNAPSCSVGVYIENDVELAGVVIPLTITSVDSGAFITSNLGATAQGRLDVWTWAGSTTIKKYYTKSADHPSKWCVNGDPEAEVWNTYDTTTDFVSPNALLYAGVGQDSILRVGADSGIPSLLLIFGVSDIPGTFEIDSTCIPPGNRLTFVATDIDVTEITPIFEKGVVEIAACLCECHADPNCDEMYNIVDFILIRDVARGTHVPIPDPSQSCPVVTTDLNCDDTTTTADQNIMYGILFYGDDPDSVLCAPCE